MKTLLMYYLTRIIKIYEGSKLACDAILIITCLIFFINYFVETSAFSIESKNIPYFQSINYTKNMNVSNTGNTGILILSGGNLIDVDSDDYIKRNFSIVIYKEKISDISHNDDFDIQKYFNSYPNLTMINTTGKYILPGLFDMHAHIAGVLDGNFDQSVSEQMLSQLLNYGITTIRNPGGPTEESVNMKEMVASGEIIGPQILTAGRLLNSPHIPIPFVAIMVETEEQVRNEIKKQADLGVDFIKLYVGLSPNLVKTAIEESHRNGIKVIGHLYSTGWTEAANMGIDYLTHGVPVNPSLLSNNNKMLFELNSGGPFSHLLWLSLFDINSLQINNMIDSLVKNNVSVDPTLSIYEAMLGGDSDDPLWTKVLQLTKKMYDSDLRLLTGSDIPNLGLVPGKSLHNEMKILVQSGIHPQEVIKIATKNGAEALGLIKETGTIEIGKYADLVVLSSNPVENISNTLDIELVISDGKIIGS